MTAADAATGTTAGRYHPVADSMAMIGRSLRHSIRQLDTLLLGVLLPLGLLVMFTYVFGGAIDTGGAYIDFVVPSTILLCAGYGASMTAVSVTTDMTEGIVDRFRTMSVVSSAVLTGHVVASVLRNLVSTTLVVLLALVLGFRPTAGPQEWFGVAALLTLFILALSWLAACVGLIARSVDAASALGFFILFLPYVSSAFVPIATLPTWLQPVAEHQPITPIVETLRGLLFDGPVAPHGWIAIAWCAAILLFSIIGSVLLWRRSRAR